MTMVAPDMTRTTVRMRGKVALVDLAGDINAGAEQAIASAWHEATQEGAEAVVLNFENAGYINSTGIALIVGMLAQARAAKVPLGAFGLTPHYQEIFQITRLADFMAIRQDEDSAVRGAEGSTT
jgi:anti-anti-sigma factor